MGFRKVWLIVQLLIISKLIGFSSGRHIVRFWLNNDDAGSLGWFSRLMMALLRYSDKAQIRLLCVLKDFGGRPTMTVIYSLELEQSLFEYQSGYS